MLIHLNDSQEAAKFFAQAGITIDKDSAHNAITFIRDGVEMTLWAESDHSVACGIPGIYVDE